VEGDRQRRPCQRPGTPPQTPFFKTDLFALTRGSSKARSIPWKYTLCCSHSLLSAISLKVQGYHCVQYCLKPQSEDRLDGRLPYPPPRLGWVTLSRQDSAIATDPQSTRSGEAQVKRLQVLCPQEWPLSPSSPGTCKPRPGLTAGEVGGGESLKVPCGKEPGRCP
jgi:hypothetical protein